MIHLDFSGIAANSRENMYKHLQFEIKCIAEEYNCDTSPNEDINIMFKTLVKTLS